MGGREYALIGQEQPSRAVDADADQVLHQEIMLLPAVDPHSGPFQRRAMGWHPAEPALASGEREVALSWYLALVIVECLDIIIGARGPTIVEGSLARNRFFLRMLWAASGRRVIASNAATGTSIGAALLFETANQEPAPARRARRAKRTLTGLARRYRGMPAQWRKRAAV